ncbi:hypothetical protein SAMN05192552_101221 [Natrinema hispanicum]|uniref:Uncharacterized protein n=1 Tax=Natrinema hispanicum TaxID=392421 RepID=A0A1G6RV40_9EURY|nr:hypothetical protein SAMN05192552_101221 [Natrinema hispanicum]
MFCMSGNQKTAEDLIEENREILEEYAEMDKEASDIAKAILKYYDSSLMRESNSMSSSPITA